METANTLTVQQRTALLDTLQARFERNERLHPGIAWENVRAKLEADDGKLRSLFAMEKTGGQPDVVAYDHAADAYVFYDCAPESPAGRRNLCYDRAAWEARKRNKPEGNVVDAAAAMGIALLPRRSIARCRSWGSSTSRRRAGSKRPPRCVRWAARCSATAASTACSPSTTAPSPTTLHAAFAARCACSPRYSSAWSTSK